MAVLPAAPRRTAYEPPSRDPFFTRHHQERDVAEDAKAAQKRPQFREPYWRRRKARFGVLCQSCQAQVNEGSTQNKNSESDVGGGDLSILEP